MDERLRSHYESLNRAILFTRNADRKAAPVLAVHIALLGTLATQLEKLQIALISDEWSIERILIILSLMLYLVFLSISFSLAALVYVPVHPKTGESVVYFEDIASMDYTDFKRRAVAVTPNMIEIQLLDQVYRVSIIASQKMARVTWAFIFAVPSIILWCSLLSWTAIALP